MIYGDVVKYKEFLKDAHMSFLLKTKPYIEVNPAHEGFDLLLGTPLESLLMHHRTVYDELLKYKI
jgi:hypothetical protein